jgi:hypothetical protein
MLSVGKEWKKTSHVLMNTVGTGADVFPVSGHTRATTVSLSRPIATPTHLSAKFKSDCWQGRCTHESGVVSLCACPGALSRKLWSLSLHAYTLKRSRSHQTAKRQYRPQSCRIANTAEHRVPEPLVARLSPTACEICGATSPLLGEQPAASSGFCLGSGPYRNCDWLATTEETPRPSLNHDHFVLKKFGFDGRWSIAIAIAIAIKYGMSSAAAWIAAVSKRDPSTLRRTVEAF